MFRLRFLITGRIVAVVLQGNLSHARGVPDTHTVGNPGVSCYSHSPNLTGARQVCDVNLLTAKYLVPGWTAELLYKRHGRRAAGRHVERIGVHHADSH